MTTRTYDYILTVNSTVGFTQGNNIIGITSGTEGFIANVNPENNTIKVKVDNVLQEYNIAETCNTTFITTSGGSVDINQQPYFEPSYNATTVVSSCEITNIQNSNFIREKNAFVQRPSVRLYTLYYPGEWYPPNQAGNPTGEGTGYPWPDGLPFRFAEIRGETASDIQYECLFGGESFLPYPIESGDIGIDSSGQVNEIQITISNFDNLITTLVENPFLVGNNSSNSNTAIVNGEYVTNIDPRTNPEHPDFDENIAASRGGYNVAFDYDTTISLGDTWNKLKIDTRDLLGGVIEIKSTYANFLDVWPEYSIVRETTPNLITVASTLPYRIGDIVRSNSNQETYQIINMFGDNLITDTEVPNVKAGDKLYIVNEEADQDGFVVDNFKIDSLDTLNPIVAVFAVVSWLQYFKLQLPKRKYFKNSCPWSYKGPECQYPDNGSDLIPGDTQNRTANGYFDINNAEVLTVQEDVCAKNFEACTLRNNNIHFGGFPGTGRTIPR